MAMAKIRTCHRCKAKFMKEEGCNKMTCKCGASMCYVCRKPDISYKHFCQHLREPKKPCDKCNDCFLWSKAEEDDERAIAEIRKECEVLRMEKGFSLDRVVGAPDEPPAKKMKVK
ncbi:E3 ubiquitin-protein ligase RNF216-like [Saccostrea cucullata]|uniref:E3 ubiquitin-protein ligase RNF216-like n=1 Tax=Saccostrea cuccullata TaxID=36930 RepID=UPI002ED47FBD